MLTTWRQRERRDGIVLKTISFPVPPPSTGRPRGRASERAITPQHARASWSATSRTSPARSSRSARSAGWARERGIEVIVDGAHAFAHFPFTRADLDCDYYGTSLHKWLLAPHGTGFLYVRKAKIAKLWPLMAAPPEMDGEHPQVRGDRHPPRGQPQRDRRGAHLPRGHRRRAQGGAPALPARPLGAAAREARRACASSPASIPRMSCGLGNVELEGVDPTSSPRTCGTRRRIIVTPIVHEEFQGLRVTPNVYTTLEEVDAFAEEMERVIAAGLPVVKALVKSRGRARALAGGRARAEDRHQRRPDPRPPHGHLRHRRPHLQLGRLGGEDHPGADGGRPRVRGRDRRGRIERRRLPPGPDRERRGPRGVRALPQLPGRAPPPLRGHQGRGRQPRRAPSPSTSPCP